MAPPGEGGFDTAALGRSVLGEFVKCFEPEQLLLSPATLTQFSHREGFSVKTKSAN